MTTTVIYQRQCQRCGKEFETTRRTKRFCSGACKQQQYRRRRDLQEQAA